MAEIKGLFIPPDIGPRWIEIDLDAVMHNVKAVKALLQPGTRLMAVVKADGYGCGGVEVSRAVLEAGADMLGVTTVDEGMELRDKGIEAPILIFSPVSLREVPDAVRSGLTLSVDDPDVIREGFSDLSGPAAVHLKINTGMNRFGMQPEQAEECLRLAEEITGLEVEGIYTHLATTGAIDKAFVEKQFNVFKTMVSALEQQGMVIPLKHVCNSAAFLDMPHIHLDMVRIGTLLYGQYPFGYHSCPDKGPVLKDPWTARARLVRVRQVPAGETVGYGRDFRAKKNTTVGMIAVGIADGLDVAPQFKPKNFVDLARMVFKTIFSFFGKRVGTPLVTFKGRPLDIVGRIGMQVTALDLSEAGDVREGDTVEVFLRRTTAGSRLPRVYISQGRLKAVRTPSGYRSYSEEYL